MLELYIDFLNMPESCLVERKIPKSMVFRNTDIKARAKSIFSKYVEKITLKYMLQPTNLNVEEYSDEEKEYEEIALIEVVLEDDSRYKLVADIIQKAIPYPIIVLMKSNKDFLINLAAKRKNKNDDTKLIIYKQYYTDWVNVESLKISEKQFLKSLNTKNLTYTNLFEFYKGIQDIIICYQASEYTEDFDSIRNKNADKIEIILEEIERLDDEIASLRSKMKSEMHYNRKVQMNIEINALKKEKRKLVSNI